MKKSVSKSKKPINQTQLGKMLNLSPKAIQHLKDENVIKWKKVGRQNIFNKTSIKQFQQSFNRDDYITKRECDKKLSKWGFTSFRDSRLNVYINPLHIYINTTKLIIGTNDIPNEYLLTVKQFGDTKYITKKSFAITLNWLRNINHRINPKQTQQQIDELNILFKKISEKKKNFIKNYNKGRKIKFNTTQLRYRFGVNYYNIRHPKIESFELAV